MGDPVVVQITPGPDGEPWTASVRGVTFPLVSFVVEQGESRPAVSLILDADLVQIGTPTTPAPAVAPATKPAPSVWGKPAADPRAGIPGWAPEALEATDV